jgi:hypothetical protein
MKGISYETSVQHSVECLSECLFYKQLRNTAGWIFEEACTHSEISSGCPGNRIIFCKQSFLSPRWLVPYWRLWGERGAVRIGLRKHSGHKNPRTLTAESPVELWFLNFSAEPLIYGEEVWILKLRISLLLYRKTIRQILKPVPMRRKALTVLEHPNTGIANSNPVHGINVLCAYGYIKV